MLLKEIFEAPEKTAVIAWGRMNPPTIGHQKVIDVLKTTAQKLNGEAILFVTQTQDKKKNPLSFAEKIHFTQEFFPGVTLSKDTSIKTIIQALEKLQKSGYKNVVVIAGSDRVPQYQDLIDKYNNKADTKGIIPFAFDNAKVVSSGERDPDADDVSGMSASKLRQFATDNDFDSFKQGVPGSEILAKQMFARVRKGLGLDVNEIMGFATRTPKRNTVKKRPPEPEELSVADKIKKRRALASKVGVDKAFRSDSIKSTEAAGVGIITKQNTTKDVNKGTLRKMLKSFKLI